MKNMKKFASLLLALVMVLSLATTAFAAKITIDDGDVTGATYTAYKLLNATNDGGKFAYTLNEKYTTALTNVTGEDEQADIVAYIDDLDDDGIRAFADAVYAQVKDMDPDATAAANVFDGVDQGYYLIVETVVGNEADTISLVMLDTAGDEAITVTTKEDAPSVDKQVEEVNDTTGESGSWGETADYDINDVIDYKITGTVSSKYADYKSYYYSFADTMDKGLTYNNDAKVYVVNGDSKIEVTDQFDIDTTTNNESNLLNGFEATANLKNLTGVTITATTTIVVEYTATLNEYAVSGKAGNLNEVVLEYNNDPYFEGTPEEDDNDKPEEPGETPKDTNIVFTYDVVVKKVDNNNLPLEGAGFTLYKEVGGSWVKVGSEVKGDAMTTFNFNKLDEGKYKLEESTVPEGYNKAADVEFTVESTLDNQSEALTNLVVKNSAGEVISGEDKTFNVATDFSKIETEVVNNSGTELPETGGIGTTMFYVFGSIMVLAAAVLLITKKRMSVAE